MTGVGEGQRSIVVVGGPGGASPTVEGDDEVVALPVPAAETRRGRVLNDALRASDGESVAVVDAAARALPVTDALAVLGPGALAVDRVEAVRAGGFDERIRAGAVDIGPVEVDLLLRLRARRRPVAFEPGFAPGPPSDAAAVGWGMAAGAALRRSGAAGLGSVRAAAKVGGVVLDRRGAARVAYGVAHGLLLAPQVFVDAVLVATPRAVARPRPDHRSHEGG